MTQRFHIAILKADEVEPALSTRFGELEDMMQSMLRVEHDVEFKCTTFRVYKNELPINVDEFDGFLITGSRSSVFDNESWIKNLMQFVRYLDIEKRRVAGICFGHQLIAEALGGRVTRASQGWGVGVQAYDVKSQALQLGIDSAEVSLPCCHQDQVVTMPPNAIRFLSNDFCENAGFVLGKHILAVQPHPEFSVTYLECILRAIEDKISDRIDEALSSLQKDTDNWVFEKLIAKFLRGEFSSVKQQATVNG